MWKLDVSKDAELQEAIREYRDKWLTAFDEINEKRKQGFTDGQILGGLRLCANCGAPMADGFHVDFMGCNYCSMGCMLMEVSYKDYLAAYDNGKGDSYYTQWEEFSEL